MIAPKTMADYEHIIHPLEPVFDADSRILVLGSLPSVLSRKNDFYYGNPQNRFWKVLACLLEIPEPQNISEKTEMLLSHRIALWDVIAECDIRGSSDASIKNVTPVDITHISSTCRLKAIFANGATAQRLYHRYLEDTAQREAVCLPSTSPANAAYSLERLIDAWRVVLAALA